LIPSQVDSRHCSSHNALHVQYIASLDMKTTTLPPLRVTPELRASAEAVLGNGETLSAFVLDAVTRSIEQRRAQQAFIARGLESRAKAMQSGRYVTADTVVRKLHTRLEKAKRAARG
jgi:predicted transcriptional regulator